uniref:Hydroxyproline-rich glycoprotein family protein n=1 Tax=Chenopodium quinoa TaxID=63459 RepID=A0A803KR53_CHEQI
MEQTEDDPPPFWMQSNAALRQADRHRRRHNPASSLFLNTGVLVAILLAAAVVFLAIVIPSVLSLARSVFNPSLVKSSWNSLNLILVLFAIVCGFLGRKDDDQTPVSSPMRQKSSRSAESSTPRRWYEYQDSRMAHNSFGNADTMRRLRRNSSSYPDLRQEGQWMMGENRWRSYDDTHVYNHQFSRSESRISRSRSLGVVDEDEFNVKNIEVDTFVGKTKRQVHSTSAPPPAPPPPARPLQQQYQNLNYARPSPKTKTTPSATRRTLPPAKTDSFSSIDKDIGNGSESPLIPIPPPPPPPPFKMSAWRFVTQGDYVKIESNNSSPRSGYSASEDEDSSPSNKQISNVFCPSPDVDTKADDFIARFKAKLTLDKMNSIKRNHGTGPSPLGSDSGRS